MTITPEERQQWRKRSMNQFCAEDIFRLLDALEKVESQRDAYIRETGKYARECGLQDAEIGRLKERAEKAERERGALYQEMFNLITESEGVAGMHLNGEIATWDWLVGYGWLENYAAQEAAKEAGVMHGSDGLPAFCDNCWKLEPGRDGDCWECDQSKTPPSEWTDFSTVPEEISSLQGEGEK